MKYLIILIVLVVLGILIYLKFFKGKLKKQRTLITDFITFFCGGEGSGKTGILSHLALNEKHKRMNKNIFIKIRNKFRKIFKMEILELANIKIYSTFPIYDKRDNTYSYVIDNKVLTWKYKVEKGSIIVLDELGYLFPKEEKMASKEENFTITFLRQVLDEDILGNKARLFASSQSISDVKKVFRAKTQIVYMLSNMRVKKFFRSKVNALKILMNEDVKNIYEDNLEDNIYKFKFPFGAFDSKYGSNFYNLKENEIRIIAKDYSKLLEYYGYKCGDQWRDLKIGR